LINSGKGLTLSEFLVHRDGEVCLPVPVARRILRLLDGLGDAGRMGYRGDEAFEREGEPVPEAAELAHLLYDALHPTIVIGDRVTDGESRGRVVALVLFPTGWEAHVVWDDRGVEVVSVERLSPAEP